jgi:beta-mannosidase
MSEYGFQSFPDWKTIEAFTAEKDREIHSKVMELRQRCPNGNQKIIDYMLQEYGHVPGSFENFVMFSQLLQARAIKTAIEAHRRARPYCMGTLYWQLNDCWPTMSWSSIDYHLRPKAAHYFAAKANAPLLLSFKKNDAGTVSLTAVSDLRKALTGELQVQLIDMRGHVAWQKSEQLTIAGEQSRIIWQEQISTLTRQHAAEQLILTAVFITATGETTAQSSFLLVRPKDIAVSKAGITLSSRKIEGGLLLDLHSDEYQHAVVIQLKKGEGNLSDNYFELLPGQTYQVVLTSSHADEVELAVHSLMTLLKQ